MDVTQQQIQYAIRDLHLSGQPICVHASLRSFGWVVGGAATLLQACLDEQCTVLVPTFSWSFAVPPPPRQQFPRNGWNYAAYAGPGIGKCYKPTSSDVDGDMGTLAAAVLAHPTHIRGDHPLCSFAAVGPRAGELVATQTPTNVYAALRTLARLDGFAVLMGVGLTALTLGHAAEQAAGRMLFRRWANNAQGQPTAVEVGGCSASFGNFQPYLRPWSTTKQVGASQWTVLPSRQALTTITQAIQAQPTITHCGDPACERCRDAVVGGPTL